MTNGHQETLDSRALEAAIRADTKIDQHEDVCEIRYAMIRSALDRLFAILLRSVAAIILLLIGIIGFLWINDGPVPASHDTPTHNHKTIDSIQFIDAKKKVLLMDAQQFRQYIVRPTLYYLGMHNDAAENLLIGTAAQESNLHWLVQHGNSYAKGVFQIEPPTHADVWRYLRTRPDIALKVQLLASYEHAGTTIPDEELIYNLRYSTAIARIKYWMIPQALPDASDIEGLAHYYKDYYNTIHGAATPEDFMKNYPT